MSNDYYDAWLKSRQVEKDIDVAGPLMDRITREVNKPTVWQRARQTLTFDLFAARPLLRLNLLITGAVAGLLRTLFIVYYALFA